ncbi:MAG: hypothetical protein KDE09_11035 [Anaerolineales bacterium]|nr:hypothetical protein [Anaerolineales bacterium]
MDKTNLEKQIQDQLIQQFDRRLGVKIGSTATITVNLETLATQDGRSFAAANCQYINPGSMQTTLGGGVVGVGNNPNEALNVMLQEWLMLYGLPIASFLKGIPDGHFAGLEMYVSPVGIRGAAAPPPSDPLTIPTQILAMIGQAYLLELDTWPMPLLAQVAVDEMVATSSELRLNGIVSAQLGSKLLALHWPKGQPHYILKQFMIVQKS